MGALLALSGSISGAAAQGRLLEQQVRWHVPSLYDWDAASKRLVGAFGAESKPKARGVQHWDGRGRLVDDATCQQEDSFGRLAQFGLPFCISLFKADNPFRNLVAVVDLGFPALLNIASPHREYDFVAVWHPLFAGKDDAFGKGMRFSFRAGANGFPLNSDALVEILCRQAGLDLNIQRGGMANVPQSDLGPDDNIVPYDEHLAVSDVSDLQPRPVACDQGATGSLSLVAGGFHGLPAGVVSADGEHGGGDGRNGGGNARPAGYRPIYVLPPLVFFVVGIAAMARVIWWGASMWLLLPGWLATVGGGAGVFGMILWWIVIDGAWKAPLLGLGLLLGALGLVWRGVWHGVVLIRDGRPLYHNVVGIGLVLAGMAVLWTGMWLLFADSPSLASVAQAGIPHLRWEGGEV